MDFHTFFCGLNFDRFRRGSIFSLPNRMRTVQSPQQLLKAIRMGRALTNNSGAKRRHLPAPTGPHTVGCVDIMSGHTVDGTFIRLYYPTTPCNILEREAQWPLWLPRKHYGKGYVYFRRMNLRVFGAVMNWVGGDVYVPALWQAPILQTDTPFPVILFSHGLGGNRTTNTVNCLELASHGFIVAAIEHRDGSASMTYCFRPTLNSAEEEDHDVFHHHSVQEEWLRYKRQNPEDDYQVRNQQVHKRAEEMIRVLQLLERLNEGEKMPNMLQLHFDTYQFQGRLDLDKVGIVGHSFGAATSIATLTKSPKFRAAVALDSWMLPLEESLYDKVKQPVLLVNTETFQWEENVRPMFNLGVNNGDKARILLTVRGTCHQSVTDFQFLVPRHIGKIMSLRDRLEPKVAMQLNMQTTLGFLYKHLGIEGKDHHDNLLMGKHSEIIVGTNLDLVPKNLSS